MAHCSVLKMLVSMPKRGGNKNARVAGMTDETFQEISFKDPAS